MLSYLNILNRIINEGEDRSDRTGVGTRSIFGVSERFDLSKGFPAVTTKKLAFRSVMGELLWFLNGEIDLADLRYRTFGDRNADKKTIWDANQADLVKRRDEKLMHTGGESCGYIYGALWNNSNQLRNVVERIQKNPNDRRLLVSAWIPEIVNNNLAVALPPCHYSFQFYVRQGKYLDLLWNQRSVDAFLGLPFNIASYAALVHIVAEITGLKPGILTFNGGDVHIYQNHFKQVVEQLSRDPLPLPQFRQRVTILSMDDLQYATADNFFLDGYDHHGAIKAPMAV